MMMRDHTFRQAFQILNTCWLFVLIGTLLEPNIFIGYLPVSIRVSFWGLFLSAGVAAARILFCSGLFGMLLEVASREEIVFTRGKFFANVKKNWLIYLFIVLLQGVLHFLLFSLRLQDKIPFRLVFWYSDVFFLFLLARWLMAQKYLKPLAIARRKESLSSFEVVGVLGLLGWDIFLYHFNWLVVPGMDTVWVGTGLYKAGQLFGFLFFSLIMLQAYPEIQKSKAGKKELYLIQPATSGVISSLAVTLANSHPAWFAILKALTPASYVIREFRRVIWNPRYYAPGKLVAISCFSGNSPEAYKIAKEFRRHGSTVIMGGPHVTGLPDEALEFCDSVVIGEAEGVWSQVVADYEQGCLKRKYWAQENAAAFAQVYNYLAQSPPEIIRDNIEAIRGCKYDCYFCAVPGVTSTQIRRRTVGEITALLGRFRSRFTNFGFLDNNIYADPAYARQLFEAMQPLGLRWAGLSSIDIGQNEAMLKLAKKSGCETLLIGYEIIEDSPEQQQGGKLAMAKKYLEMTRKIQAAGIKVKAHFIVGFDADDGWAWFKLWKFCQRMWPSFSVILLLTPFPGSRFFVDALAEGRITTLNWRNYNCMELVYKPRRMPYYLLNQPAFTILSMFIMLVTSRGAWFAWILLAVIVYMRLR